MIVIEFIGTCRRHDRREIVQMMGKDTPRQLEEGYTRLSQKMRCSDYSKTHSVTSHPRGAVLPYLFRPNYPEPEQPMVNEFLAAPRAERWDQE